MNICVFDTETTDLKKPFCYNVGYVIYDLDNRTILVKKDYVTEQIWHNLPLFNTAYYANKRLLYISAMKGRRAKMEKWGNVCQAMARDFKKFDVQYCFAYNSPFDEKVFNFNCEWYRNINPFDNLPIFDIRGYAFNSFLNTKEYKQYCESQQLFTENGSYSTTAESVTKFIRQDPYFIEEHTALSDSLIELDILLYCLNYNIKIDGNYKAKKKLERQLTKTLTINYKKLKKEYSFKYTKIRINKDKTKIVLE